MGSPLPTLARRPGPSARHYRHHEPDFHCPSPVAHILELIESSLEFCVGCLKQDGNDVQAEPELMSHEQTVVRDR